MGGPWALPLPQGDETRRGALILGHKDEEEPHGPDEEGPQHEGAVDLKPLPVGQGRTHPGRKEDGEDGQDGPGDQHEDAVRSDQLLAHGQRAGDSHRVGGRVDHHIGPYGDGVPYVGGEAGRTSTLRAVAVHDEIRLVQIQVLSTHVVASNAPHKSSGE